MKPFAEIVDDRVIGPLMVQIGYRSKNLEKYISDRKTFALVIILNSNIFYLEISMDKKEYFKHDLQTTFEFENLPQEILDMIVTSLLVQDIVNLFSVSNHMHQWFKSFDSNSLWKSVLNNTKILLDGDIPMPAENFKKCVLDTER